VIRCFFISDHVVTSVSSATSSVYGSSGATVDDLRKRSRNGIMKPPRRKTGI